MRTALVLPASPSCRWGMGGRLPNLDWEFPGDLGLELGEDRYISGVEGHKVHAPKLPFSPGILYSGPTWRLASLDVT